MILARRLLAGFTVAGLPLSFATCADQATVDATRVAAAQHCDRASATSHGEYVHCVGGVVNAVVAAKTLHRAVPWRPMGYVSSE